MMNENDYSQPADRDLLKKVRKERKRLKKETKRYEKEKEHEKEILDIRYGSKDSRIKIISKNTADRISETKKVENYTPSCNLTISDDSSKCVQQSDSSTASSVPVTRNITGNTKTFFSNKRTKSELVEIGIMDILIKTELPVKSKDKDVPTKQYSGNILDSDQPERKKGKQREFSKEKPPSKLKSAILNESKIEDIEPVYDDFHYPGFENNFLTEELNESVKLFLRDIVKFQENLYKREPLKAIIKRRYAVGFREVQKYLLTNKFKIIIIAPNIKTTPANGALDNTVNNLITLAEANDVPYVFALTRRILGHITLKHIPVSCVGIFNCDGAEDIFKDVLSFLQKAKDLYNNYTLGRQDLEKDTTQILTENFTQILNL